MMSARTLAGLGTLGAIFAVMFLVLIGIAFYVVYSFTLYKLAKKRGTANEWLAWIPLGQFYLLGETCGEMELFGKLKIKQTGLYFMLVPVASWIVSGILSIMAQIPVIGIMFLIVLRLFNLIWPIVFTVFMLCILYRIYSAYFPKDNVLVYTIISVIGVAQPVFFYLILKKEPISAGYDFRI